MFLILKVARFFFSVAQAVSPVGQLFCSLFHWCNLNARAARFYTLSKMQV